MKPPKAPILSAKTVAQAGELLLRQIDKTGYYLSKFGLTDQFNRHNCIALFIMGGQRIRGELSRLQLKLSIQKRKIQKKCQ